MEIWSQDNRILRVQAQEDRIDSWGWIEVPEVKDRGQDGNDWGSAKGEPVPDAVLNGWSVESARPGDEREDRAFGGAAAAEDGGLQKEEDTTDD